MVVMLLDLKCGIWYCYVGKKRWFAVFIFGGCYAVQLIIVIGFINNVKFVWSCCFVWCVICVYWIGNVGIRVIVVGDGLWCSVNERWLFGWWVKFGLVVYLWGWIMVYCIVYYD